MTHILRIFVAGHKGMVGSALVKHLRENGYTNLILASIDLRNQDAVNKFFDTERPEVVINCAAKVGGILANNNNPYQFLMYNMQIQNNLIESSLRTNVKRFIFLGSSCIYPKEAQQPIKEEYLLTGPLESTNEWYAIAKISGVKLCESIKKQFGKDYICLMPTNLYGPNDNFDLDTSHVLPAMIRKFHEAKVNNNPSVTLWGSGTPMREFLHVNDLVRAIFCVLEVDKFYDLPATCNVAACNVVYNVGYGKDITIKQLADIVQRIVGYEGTIIWDKSKPDGTPRKLLDSSKMNNLGWKPIYSLESGISDTYKWFIEQK